MDMTAKDLDRLHEYLRERVVQTLLQQGFTIKDRILSPPNPSSKDEIRELHAFSRKQKLAKAKEWILAREDALIEYFADGEEVSPRDIYPRLEPVNTRFKSDLFRYASLLWSIPVSAGYGRRLRFLVFDESNNKLMGLLALGDPVYNLGVRDRWVGWTPEQKHRALYHVMDAYVLGAVPPYSHLLMGKLIALLATSDPVRDAFWKRYAGKPSVIKGAVREPHLVLITTTSALGRSSIYNRLSLPGRKVYQSLGFTQGWGHFHFPEEIFEELRSFLLAIGDPIARSYRYGDGANWRTRVLERALKHLGLSPDLLRHGVKREFFAAPLAANTREFLRGEADTPEYFSASLEEIFTHFRERWLLPRASREGSYKAFRRENLRLSYNLKEEDHVRTTR